MKLLERLFVRAVSAPALSRPLGALAAARLPGPLLRAWIRAWIRIYGVDMSEVEPVPGYATFNDFFTRRLRAGARPVSPGPGVVVSAADSRLQTLGTIPADGRLEQIKGSTYALEALLGSRDAAAEFARGVHATLYLSPAMYHRVHAPVGGRIVSWTYAPGRLYPVNALAVRHVPGLFTVNERVAVHIESDEFGPVVAVLVGAANVGRISLSFTDLLTNTGAGGGTFRPPAPLPLAAGDELGAFNLGSTVVLLVADPGLVPAEVAEGQLLHMGQALWRRP